MRKNRTFQIALVFVVTLVLNVMLQRAPAPAPGAEEDYYCVKVQPLWGGFRHIMLCDSPEFSQDHELG